MPDSACHFGRRRPVIKSFSSAFQAAKFCEPRQGPSSRSRNDRAALMQHDSRRVILKAAIFDSSAR